MLRTMGIVRVTRSLVIETLVTYCAMLSGFILFRVESTVIGSAKRMYLSNLLAKRLTKHKTGKKENQTSAEPEFHQPADIS